MSIFTTIRDSAVSTFDHVKTVISGIFHNDVEPALTTFLHVLETNGGAVLVSLALQTVSAAANGTPFGELTKTLIEDAKTQGLAVAEIAAKSALQVAQTHLQTELADKIADVEPNNA